MAERKDEWGNMSTYGMRVTWCNPMQWTSRKVDRGISKEKYNSISMRNRKDMAGY
jgi:hypothetical protein